MEKELMLLLHEKLDKLDSRLDDQGITLERLTNSVEVHIKRTDLLEEMVKPAVEMERDVKSVVKVGTKVVAGVAAILGLLAALRETGWFQ